VPAQCQSTGRGGGYRLSSRGEIATRGPSPHAAARLVVRSCPYGLHAGTPYNRAMLNERIACALAALMLVPALAAAQTPGRRPDGMGMGMGKGPGARGDDHRPARADVGELVNLRLAQLEDDLAPAPAQMPQWKAYRTSVERMLGDVKRGERVSISETSAPRRLDAIADTVRNRLAAVEEIVDAGKALYAVLTPAQREIADRRLALPLATLLGSDPGSEVTARSPRSLEPPPGQ